MRSTKEIWEREYSGKNIPSSVSSRPSRSLPIFLDFLRSKNIKPGGKIIEPGCGRGRNGLYMAKLGFDVFGLDIASNALGEFKERADVQGIAPRVHLYNTPISKKLPFPDKFFDIGVDIEAFFRLVTKNDIYTYRKEIYRVLKDGAYLLQYQLHPGDGYYKSVLRDPSKSDDGIAVFQDKNETRGRLYTTTQLKYLFSGFFAPRMSRTLEFQDITYDIMYGMPYRRKLSLVIFQKIPHRPPRARP